MNLLQFKTKNIKQDILFKPHNLNNLKNIEKKQIIGRNLKIKNNSSNNLIMLLIYLYTLIKINLKQVMHIVINMNNV